MLQIGSIKSFARKGELVTVYFEDGKSDRFIAGSDLTSKNVVVMGNQALSQDPSQLKLYRTTKLFKNYGKQESGGYYPYLSVISRDGKLASIYNGTKRIIGDVPNTFYETTVNLVHLGNSFNGTALSTSEWDTVSTAIVFNNQGIQDIIELDAALYNLSLVGNTISKQRKSRPLVTYQFIILDLVTNIKEFYTSYQPFPLDTSSIILPPPYYYLAVQNNGVGILQFNGQMPPTTLQRRAILEDRPGSTEVFSATSSNPVAPGSVEVTILREFTTSPDIGYALNPYTTFSGSMNGSRDSITTKSWSIDYEESESVDGSNPRVFKTTGSGSGTSETHEVTTGEWGDDAIGLSTIPMTYHRSDSASYSEFKKTESPFVINDFQSVIQTSLSELSYQNTATIEHSGLHSSYGYEPVDLSVSSQVNLRSIVQENYRSIFNKGNIGLYACSKITKSYAKSLTYDESGVAPVRVRSNPATMWRYGDPNYYGDEYFQTTHPMIVLERFEGSPTSTAYTEETYSSSFEPTVFKLAYEENAPINIKPGVVTAIANLTDANKTILANCANGDNSSTTLVAVTAFFSWLTNYESVHTITTVATPNTPTVVTESSSFEPVDPDSADGFAVASGDKMILLYNDNNDSYLCWCEIANPVFNYSQASRVSTTSVDLVISKVEKIKPFQLQLSTSLLFSKSGCAVFDKLDRNRISFVETPNPNSRKYLAATLLPISASNTQSLCFEIIDNDIVFLGISGGDVTDSNADPVAANWTQYYPAKFPKPFF